MMLFTVLKREGFDTVLTYTVGDAIMLAGRDKFDLYVLDGSPGAGHFRGVRTPLAASRT